MKAIRKPRVIKAPGASTKIRIPSEVGLMNLYPKTDPFPKASRMQPNRMRAKVNPSPIPNPSIKEEITELREAKASARPKTIQFTTINGINIPSVLCKAGT